MAQRFNRAMEIMGWRVPEDEEDVFEEVHSEETAEIREVDFHAFTPTPEPEVEVPPAPVTGLRRIATVHPASYGDARLIGEAFRSGTPVIMNLEELPDTEARRIVDFAAGLVFGLHGAIERVTPRVFLLSPRDVEVTSRADGRANNLFS